MAFNMMAQLRITLAQLNPLVGDLVGNAELMRQAAKIARSAGAQVIVFPELSLTGYPPEDLLLFPAFIEQCEALLTQLATETDDGDRGWTEFHPLVNTHSLSLESAGWKP